MPSKLKAAAIPWPEAGVELTVALEGLVEDLSKDALIELVKQYDRRLMQLWDKVRFERQHNLTDYADLIRKQRGGITASESMKILADTSIWLDPAIKEIDRRLSDQEYLKWHSVRYYSYDNRDYHRVEIKLEGVATEGDLKAIVNLYLQRGWGRVDYHTGMEKIKPTSKTMQPFVVIALFEAHPERPPTKRVYGGESSLRRY